MKSIIESLLVNDIFAKKILDKIKKYKDLHRGETCYLFGDGPSIKWFDLAQFGDHCGICCGLLPFHKDFNKLDVKYCLMVEPWLFSKVFGQRQAIVNHRAITNQYKKIIAERKDIDFFLHLSSYLDVREANVSYIFRHPPKGVEVLDSLAKTIDLFGGSFHASISLASYLGFSKVFLVGFDAWTIQPARNLHWYELGKGLFFKPTNFATEFLNALKPQLDICTILMDGQSKNVDYISYATYTKKISVFRENHEIIDSHYLNVLATHPEYRIYPEPT